MKKETLTIKKMNPKNYLVLLIGATSILLSACEKKTLSSNGIPSGKSPSVQENILFGTWKIKKKDTYEITGVDSSGQFICNLVGSANYADSCQVEFRTDVNGLQYKANGTMAGCGAGEFSWEAGTKDKLLAAGTTYDIIYLSKDSAGFSNVFNSGILKLKEVVFYKRDK